MKHQLIDEKPIPTVFLSKMLSQTQIKYSTFDRDFLVAYLEVIHFCHLIGCYVVLFTDQKASMQIAEPFTAKTLQRLSAMSPVIAHRIHC